MDLLLELLDLRDLSEMIDFLDLDLEYDLERVFFEMVFWYILAADLWYELLSSLL